MTEDGVEINSVPGKDNTHLYQADCLRCGWHTRQAEGGPGKRWVNEMAQRHREVCIQPPSLNAAE